MERMNRQGRSRTVISTIVYGIMVLVLLSGCSLQATDTASEQVWGRADAKEIDINSKIAGRVVALRVKEGDVVKKGDVLAYIDQRDLLAQKAQAEANIESLEAQVRQYDTVTVLQDRTSHSSLHNAHAGLNTAKSQLDLAEKDFARYEALYQQGAVSKQAFDSYKSRYEVAQATFSQAQAAVDSADAGLMQTAVNTANVDAVKQKLEAARAQLEQLEVSIDETEIKAPFDGVITAKYIEEGSMISMGTPLVALQDKTDNWVDFKIPETKLKKYAVGQTVTLRSRDESKTLQGTITDISKKSEFATQRATSERGDDTDIITFNMKVQVNDAYLRPGMRFQLIEGETT